MRDMRPLPDRFFKWLVEERMLTEETIKKQSIGYIELQSKPWIAIPIFDENKQVEFYKLKSPPGADANQPKAKVYPHESKSRSALYCRSILKREGLKRVVVCEGELDCLVLLQNGIPAVTGTAGASTFPNEWLQYFPEDIEVVLAFDADDAGKKAREKVGKLFKRHRPDISVMAVYWPESVFKGYDVTDHYRACENRGEDATDAFWSLVESYQTEQEQKEERANPSALIVSDPEDYERTIAEVETPEVEMDIETWRAIIETNFPELTQAAEVCLSVVLQLLINNVHNCFSLTLVDVPSSGKTICLNFFDGLHEIMYASDNFTPASLVSGAANRSGKQLSKVDMLPRIRHKVLIIREMATILSEREEDLREKMGTLTRVLDGEGLVIDNGVHGRRGYQGDYMFMMLSASTPFPLRVWKAMGTTGHRLFMLSVGSKRPTIKSLIATRRSGDFKAKEMICKKATHDLIRTIWNQYKKGIEWDMAQDDENALEIIGAISNLLALYRGEIIVYQYDRNELGHTRPLQEMQHRIFTSFCNLAAGHALACGRTQINADDIGVVMRVAFDTAPDPRPALLRLLIAHDVVTASMVDKALHCSRNTSVKEMEKMVQLRIAKPVHDVQTGFAPWEQDGFTENEDRKMRLADDFQWLRKDSFMELYKRYGISIAPDAEPSAPVDPDAAT